jgi:hypothetical protein
MHARRPINPTDLLSSGGVYPGTADRIPFTQGSEGEKGRRHGFGTKAHFSDVRGSYC